MDNKSIVKNINNIFKDNNENIVLLIDGHWGIGKTYLINNELKKHEYEFKYVSVFGLENLKSIEKELLIQFIPNHTIKKYSSVIFDITNDVIKKKIGINLNNYLNNITINNVNALTNNKKQIICFDDLERKSPKINLKDLLGFIEQASQNFNIIIIANSYKFNVEEKIIFNEYKEKILDYGFKLNKINNEIFDDLINKIRIEKRLNPMDKNERMKLISIYTKTSNNSNNFEKINNIRIYKKYINLICKLETYLSNEIGNKFSKLTNNSIEACQEVIFSYYDKDFSVKKSSFDKEIIKKEILQLFLCKDLTDFIINEYLEIDINLDIKKDISSLWRIYSMNEEEYKELIQKIEKKIEKKDINYFVNPKNVISLFDVFVNLEINKNYKNDLLIVIDKIIAESNFKKKIYHSDEWDDVDYSGKIECDPKTQAFINDVNIRIQKKHKKIMKLNYENAIFQRDIKEIQKIFSFKIIDNEDDFFKIFDFAFNNLIKTNEREYLVFIESLIDNTETNIVDKYLKEKKKVTSSFIIQKKYEHFERILQEKSYMEYQADNYNDSMFEDFQDNI